MLAPAPARRRRLPVLRSPAAAVLCALALLVGIAAVLPDGAPAGQSSAATPAPFSQLGGGLYHSCALVDDGGQPAPPGRPVRCWGFSGDGQVGYGNVDVIGDDDVPAAAGPVDLGAGRTARALAVGDYHSCAALDTGDVRCWGYANEGQVGLGNRNQIGDNETPGSVGPVSLGAGRSAAAITAGGNHTCAVLDDGDVRCWGLGEFGQLGYGTTASIGDNEQVSSAGPVDLTAGRTAKAITAGAFHTCAILDDDSVRCWGLGSNGQLGYGATSAVLNPALVAAPVDLGDARTARAITAGASHTCAVLDDGNVRCWGLNDSGQLGYASTVSIGDNEPVDAAGPVDLGAGRSAIAISSGGEHTCVVLDNGRVRCWGSGVYGQLGNGNLSAIGDDETPGSIATVDLGPGRTATAIAAGIYHTCARLDDASVRCWGNGADGRLGHCSRADIGDDETPGSIGPVDIGFGGIACPVAPAPPPPPAPAAPPPPPPAAAPPPPPPPTAARPSTADALRAERTRARGLRDCRAAVSRQARGARGRALRRYRRGSRPRVLALRAVARRAARGRVRCMNRFVRVPARVTSLTASARAPRTIVLRFRAAGTDGPKAPAARSYLVKQSLRPIRGAADFRRATALCGGACRFDVTEPRALITLEVTQLRRRTRYYYAVAARDNVTRRTGPRSGTVRVTTR